MQSRVRVLAEIVPEHCISFDELDESTVLPGSAEHLQSKKQYERIGRSERRSHSSGKHAEIVEL